MTTDRTPREHPPESSLEDLVSGTLVAAERALLEAHLHHCAQCRSRVAELSKAGGAFLASHRTPPISELDLGAKVLAPAALDSTSPGSTSLSTVWQRLEAALPTEPLSDPFDGFPVPAASRDELARSAPLEWESIGPARVARLAADEAADDLLFLVDTPPGVVFPHHRHLGGEELVILQGGLTDEVGYMGLGDFRHYPAGTEHAPLMDPDQRCLALALIHGGLDFL